MIFKWIDWYYTYQLWGYPSTLFPELYAPRPFEFFLCSIFFKVFLHLLFSWLLPEVVHCSLCPAFLLLVQPSGCQAFCVHGVLFTKGFLQLILRRYVIIFRARKLSKQIHFVLNGLLHIWYFLCYYYVATLLQDVFYSLITNLSFLHHVFHIILAENRKLSYSRAHGCEGRKLLRARRWTWQQKVSMVDDSPFPQPHYQLLLHRELGCPWILRIPSLSHDSGQ